jgi:L-threonylcarbamoyladenylate synthase
MPGPLTLLLPAGPEAPLAPVVREDVVGLRCPDHGVPLRLAKEFGPLTATSANLHGAPGPRTVDDARRQVGRDATLYIDAGPCPLGQGSTVVDLTTSPPTVKREGALPVTELRLDG